MDEATPIQPQAPNPPSAQSLIQTHTSHRWTLILLGLGEAILPLLGLYVLLPLIELQKVTGDNLIAPYFGVLFFSLAFLIGVIQVILGIFSLDRKLGEKRTWRLIIGGLIVTALCLPAYISFIIYPIYATINSITN